MFLVQRVKRVFQGVVLLSIPSELLAQSISVPIITNNDGEVYVAVELNSLGEGEVYQQYELATKTGQAFLTSAKSNADLNKYYTSLDDTNHRLKSGEIGIDPEGLKKIQKIEYDKQVIQTGNYLHIPTTYHFANRAHKWREDYLCDNKSCLRSMTDFGQPFEIAYRYFVKRQEAIIKSNLEGLKRDTESAKQKIFPLPVGGSTALDNMSSIKVLLKMKRIQGDNCVRCEKAPSNNKPELDVLSNFRKLVSSLDALSSSTSEDASKFLAEKTPNFREGKSIRVIKWVKGMPQKVSTNGLGYLTVLREYSNGKIEGYIPDGGYLYLLVSKKDKSVEQKEATKTFQIFVLKKEVNTEQFNIHPHVPKKLKSKTFLFQSQILTRLAQLMEEKEND